MGPIIVRTDKIVLFDRVVQVLDVAKNAGVEEKILIILKFHQDEFKNLLFYFLLKL